MLRFVIISVATLVASLALVAQTPPQPAPATSSSAISGSNPCGSNAEDLDTTKNLLRVRRIYVDSFGDDALSKQVQAMVINSLSESKRFVITENKAKADATLKGASVEKTSQEFHGMSEGTGVGSAGGSHHSNVNGSFLNGNGTVSGSSSGGFAAHAARIDDAVASTETINDARIAVRLVDNDGDVVWTSTQESKGAKYKGATADVADKITKQLLRDIEKLEKGATTTQAPPRN
ncbi:MAG TPA: hypothetical protein VE994_01105 [Terriglobales bacterium]|nr:hypothetical protein [Terriglobales bacterium]